MCPRATGHAHKRHSAPRDHDPREHRFYRFFFVACHCRDWNTVAIRDGMGYPSHVFFHCPNSTTKHRRVWGTPTRLLPLLPIRRVPPRAKALEGKQNRRNASFAYRRAREGSWAAKGISSSDTLVPPRARRLLKQCGYYPRWARVAKR